MSKRTGGNAARLIALTRGLQERWQQTRDSWRDTQAREFEKNYLRELETAVDSAANSIEHLESTLRRIQSDCE